MPKTGFDNVFLCENGI